MTATWCWLAKALLVVLFGFLYLRGGRSGKWQRRFLGGGGLALALNTLATVRGLWTPWWWLLLAAYPAALSMGYGENTGSLWRSVLRRLLYGLGLAACAVLVGWLTGNWVVAGFQAGLAVAASVVFGVLNPFTSAEDEEGTIAVLSVVLVPFMV